MTERWLPVVGWEGLYEVSDLGRVWSVKRSMIRATSKLVGRYPSLRLYRDNVGVTVYVHILILEAFVGPCPEGMQACHRNDIGDDNRLSNLRWDTPSQNAFDRVRNGNHPQARQTECPNGHKWTDANTRLYTHKSGKTQRVCRRCDVERQPAKRQRRRERAQCI